jgi:hypothetical protein
MTAMNYGLVSAIFRKIETFLRKTVFGVTRLHAGQDCQPMRGRWRDRKALRASDMPTASPFQREEQHAAGSIADAHPVITHDRQTELFHIHGKDGPCAKRGG